MNNYESENTLNNTKVYCEYCGEKLETNAEFCIKCGKSIHTKSLKNINQNQASESNASFVIKNNTNQKKYNPNDSEKSRTIAALLAFFFGEIGAHRFYVGKIFTGFLQCILGLSFFISFISVDFSFEMGVGFFIIGILWSIWVFIDLILILCGVFKDNKNLILVNW